MLEPFMVMQHSDNNGRLLMFTIDHQTLFLSALGPKNQHRRIQGKAYDSSAQIRNVRWPGQEDFGRKAGIRQQSNFRRKIL
jgi:hypothetical protein